MKFENPAWRFDSPGPITDDVLYKFFDWARAIAAQGMVQDILEDFKSRFSQGNAPRSSNAGFAEGDLRRAMNEAAENAPVFIEAFLNACADAKGQGLDVPTVAAINRVLWGCKAGYQIEGDVLVAREWVSQDDDDPRGVEMLGDLDPTGGQSIRETDVHLALGSAPRITRPAASSAKPKLKVFLCHSSGDKAAVKDLYFRLLADGYEPWLDSMNLVPGQDWEAEIRKAVKSSHVVVVCLSKGSTTKTGFVQKEIKLALDVADEQPDGRIYLIPARLEDMEVPERLSKWHWVNLFEDDGYRNLLGALAVRASEL